MCRIFINDQITKHNDTKGWMIRSVGCILGFFFFFIFFFFSCWKASGSTVSIGFKSATFVILNML